MEDVTENPEKYGFCSFEDFRKNKKKWTGSDERVFETVDKAGHMYKGYFKKVKYEVNGYRTDKHEDAQRMCRDMGWRERDLTFDVQMKPLTSYTSYLLVRYYPKARIEQRKHW